MFSGLRENSILLILDKNGQRPTLHEATVVKKINPPGYMQQPFGMPETEVSYTVRMEGKEFNVEKIPANMNIANLSDGLVVADNREAMFAEVQNMCRVSEAVLETVPYHQGVKEACEEMFVTLNPQIAKDKEQQQKIDMMEKKLDGMESRFSDMYSMLQKALNVSSETPKK